MTDSDRSDFDQGLDVLAKVLRLQALDSDVKFGYFKSLRHYSLSTLFDGCQKLTETYKPKRKDDFPVPAVFIEVLGGVVKPEEPHSRTYAEIKASYRKRVILIGDEARERLEAEIEQKRQEAEESWQAVDEPVLGREPF
jgi:hypothetical protein